ncbi:MAG: type II secretion system protein [Myxococcales bacterium]|nr:type II secretion system protein [Myxococcales bacterium]
MTDPCPAAPPSAPATRRRILDGARRRRALPRGAAGGSAFTLIELLVVLAIIGLIALAGIVGLGGVRRGRLQDQAFQISRLSRNALIRSLSRATTVRMVVDLDEFRIWLEEAGPAPALVDESGRMVIPDGGGEEDAGGPWADAGTGRPFEAPAAAGEEEEEEPGGGLGLLDMLGPMLGPGSALAELERPARYLPPAFQPIDEPRMKPVQLEGLAAMRVYLPGAEEPIEEGTAYIFYREDGTADEATIHIENDRGAVYSIVIQPLTGRGALYPYPFVPEPPEVLP